MPANPEARSKIGAPSVVFPIAVASRLRTLRAADLARFRRSRLHRLGRGGRTRFDRVRRFFLHASNMGSSFAGAISENIPGGPIGFQRVEGPPNAMNTIYLTAAIVLEICGTTSLKLSDGFTRIGPTSAVVVCYVASFVLLSLALRGIDLSIAYAVWSGVGTAVVAVIGIVWFGESAGIWKLLCLALIVLGVAGLHLSERAS